MILSFYDNSFKGLQNNASLKVDNKAFRLTKRPIEMNSFECKSEAFTEDIQPTFLVLKDDVGRYIYGALAGVPLLNSDNQTEVFAGDLKSMLSSDIVLVYGAYNSVADLLSYIFSEWQSQVNQNSFNVEFVFTTAAQSALLENLQPFPEGQVVENCWSTVQTYLKTYDLYIDSRIDLVNKKVVFTIGKSMSKLINIKLWEHGIKNYGKWVAAINEAQGYYKDANGAFHPGIKWLLTSQNKITDISTLRDIFPIKKKILLIDYSDDKSAAQLQHDADVAALTELTKSLYQENIDITPLGIEGVSFETGFNVYLERGGELYKTLPVGELRYDAAGLYRIQIGYRFQGIEFIGG